MWRDTIKAVFLSYIYNTKIDIYASIYIHDFSSLAYGLLQ